MITIHVNTAREYDVLLADGLLSQAGELIREDLYRRRGGSGGKEARQICVVSDQTVSDLFGGREQTLIPALEEAGFRVTTFVFADGEDHKRMETVESLLDHLTAHHFTRTDLIVALGGGIPGDVAGFAAAIYLRGIDFVQIPTSLLAAVDSSVGGKTGVNLPAGKNLAGAFHQPNLVLFDPSVLKTLPPDRLQDGMAELLKAGFIGDPEILRTAMDLQEPTAADPGTPGQNGAAGSDAESFLVRREALLPLIARAIDVKRRIVEEDERESGSRKLLNLGHTVGHAIERCSDYRLSHGKAVAQGMLLVAEAAARRRLCREGCPKTIRQILTRFGFDLCCPFSPEDLAEAAASDKKIRGETITLVIPDYPGPCRLESLPVSELEGFIRDGLEGLPVDVSEGLIRDGVYHSDGD